MARATNALEVLDVYGSEDGENIDDIGNLYDDDEKPDPYLEPNEDDDPLFEYDEMAPNLIPVFETHPAGREALRDIARTVHDDFPEAWDSTEEYRESMAKDWKLYAGELPPKSFPHNNSANAHVPVMMENLTRLVSRVEAEIFGDWSRFYGVVAVSNEDEPTADVLTAHGNWQLREQITDFGRQMSRALNAFFIFGDVTIHSFFDRRRNTNMHETLTPDDVAIPYVHITTQADYSDLPYLVKILNRFRHEIEQERDNWVNIKQLLSTDPPEWEDEPEAQFRDSAAETAKIIPPDSNARGAYKLLQYEGWMDLPGQDRQRFVQVIMDYTTHILLKVTIHEEDDWQDRVRYKREWQELAAYRQQIREFPLLQQQWEASQATLRQDGADTKQGQSLMEQAMQRAKALEPPRRPIAPAWAEKDELGNVSATAEPMPARRVPIHMFSHGVCIENMAGAVGLSFGRQQADFNRAADVLTSQFIDASTLANCWSLLTTSQVEFPSPFKLAPGRVNRAHGISGQDLRSNIMELKPAQANPQQMEMVRQIVDWAQSSIQSPAVLSGEAGKSGETFRGLASRIEQATKAISVPARRFTSGCLRNVLVNNGRLNAIYLPETQILQVVDLQNPRMQRIRIDRSMYARDYKVEVRADLRFTSEGQRVQERMELIQLPQVVPQLQANAAWAYGALTKYLEARNDTEMINLLGPAPEKPTEPFGAMPPPVEPGAPGAGPEPPAGTPGPGGSPPGPPPPSEAGE